MHILIFCNCNSLVSNTMSEIFLNDPGTISSEFPLLPFPNDRQDANFELGVSMILHNWHTLSTAVDNSWGGPQSSEKRDWMAGAVIDEFINNKEIDIIYIHELLSGIMEDEFDSIIEDGSTINIATNIINCYKQCQENQFDLIKQAYAKWLEKQNNKKGKIEVNVIDDPLNPDISSDEEDDGQDNDNAMDQDVDMMDTSEKTYVPPLVDDDGFTVVTNKKGRR